MERWEGRVALVTGASAGFGAAIAKRLVELGMKVVGCARNIAKIQVRFFYLIFVLFHSCMCILICYRDVISLSVCQCDISWSYSLV